MPIETPGELEAEAKNTERIVDTEQEKFFDYSIARGEIDNILSSWDSIRNIAEGNRKLRDIKINIEEERSAGRVKQDETFVPVRVIDTNITREQPPFIAFLKQSRRLAIFESIDKPKQQTLLLEKEFTDGMTYEDWEIPYFKTLDGAQLHGWDFVEIVFDTTKPLHVGVEHIGHERLVYPTDTSNFQFAPRLLREFDVTVSQLKQFVTDFGFDLTEVNKLIDSFKDQRNKTTTKIYKQFFRWDGIVWVSWLSGNKVCGDWLKAPAKLFLGISHKEKQVTYIEQPSVGQFGVNRNPDGTPIMEKIPQETEVWVDSDINLYPVIPLLYRITEQNKMIDNRGRCFLDEFKQEAQTALITSYVNGVNRASNMYASVEMDDGTSASIKQLQSLEAGVILSKPLKFAHQDYPEPSVITGLQFLMTANVEETGNIAASVLNRKDTEKTATELTAAKEETEKISSVKLVLFSTFVRKICNLSWKIIQSQALQNKIKFLQITDIWQVNPMTGQPVLVPLPQPINNYEVIAQNYRVKAAGDIDVIERGERLQKMKEFWAIIANTPLALKFLEEMLRVAFPEDADKWIDFMNKALEAQRQQQTVAAMTTENKSSEQQKVEEMDKLK